MDFGQDGAFTAPKHRSKGKMALAEISRNAPAEGFLSASGFSCTAEGEVASGEKMEKGSGRGGRQNLSVAWWKGFRHPVSRGWHELVPGLWHSVTAQRSHGESRCNCLSHSDFFFSFFFF